MSAVGRPSPSRGRLLGPVPAASSPLSPGRPIWREGRAAVLGLAAGSWDRQGQPGSAASQPLRGRGFWCAAQARLAQCLGPPTPQRGSPAPVVLRPPGRGGAAASRDGSALGCLPRTDVVSALHLPRLARLFSHVASDTDGLVTLALKHMPPGGFGRGRAWRGSGPPPVLCCSGSVHHWLPRQRGQKPWEPWRWGGRLSSLGL